VIRLGLAPACWESADMRRPLLLLVDILGWKSGVGPGVPEVEMGAIPGAVPPGAHAPG
jgi:hypothetical protein